jgi:hypothetical protein
MQPTDSLLDGIAELADSPHCLFVVGTPSAEKHRPMLKIYSFGMSTRICKKEITLGVTVAKICG